MTTMRDAGRPDEALIDLFRQLGCVRVDTPVLQPAELFLDLSGEDIRRRLFVTTDADGREFCLRPEYTIPVGREHLRAGSEQADYCYLGPVFRQRAGESGEFVQAGVESLGRMDVGAADADTLGIALEGLDLFPRRDVEVRVGDMGLLGALLDALGTSAPARRRLFRAIAAGRGLEAALAPEPGSGRSDYAGLLAAIEGQDPKAARAFVEDVISIAGIAPVGGRTAGEIAERFLSRAENRTGALSDRDRDVLRRYLAVAGDLDGASAEIGALVRDAGLDLRAALDRFDERTGFIAARGIDLDRLSFSADFARSLDYYTGFVFEVRDRGSPEARYVIAGGRYDGLLQHLGARDPVPAVGCSFWLDRLMGTPA